MKNFDRRTTVSLLSLVFVFTFLLVIFLGVFAQRLDCPPWRFVDFNCGPTSGSNNGILTATRIHADYSLLDTVYDLIALGLLRSLNYRRRAKIPRGLSIGMHARSCTHGIPSTDHPVVPAYVHQ